MNVDEADEALRLHKGMYKARKEILGESNLHTKNSLYLAAELYQLKGKMEKAEYVSSSTHVHAYSMLT